MSRKRIKTLERVTVPQVLEEVRQERKDIGRRAAIIAEMNGTSWRYEMDRLLGNKELISKVQATQQVMGLEYPEARVLYFERLKRKFKQ